MLAFLDSDFGDDSQTVNESTLFANGVCQWAEEGAGSAPCAVLKMRLQSEEIHVRRKRCVCVAQAEKESKREDSAG